MQPRRIRTRSNSPALLAVVALAAGCGGSGGDGGTEQAVPRLPAAVALDLAERTDLVADALAAGDDCGADVHAERLRADVLAAVNDGRVPPAYQEELVGSANGLAEQIECRTAEPPPPPPAAETGPATTAATTTEEQQPAEQPKEDQEADEDQGDLGVTETFEEELTPVETNTDDLPEPLPPPADTGATTTDPGDGGGGETGDEGEGLP